MITAHHDSRNEGRETSYRSHPADGATSPICREMDPDLWVIPNDYAILNAGNKIALRHCREECPALNWCKGQIDWSEPPAGVIQAGEAWPVRRHLLAAHLAAQVKPSRPDCGTPAGAVFHRRNDEEACRPCLDAEAAYQRGKKAAADAFPFSDGARQAHADFGRLTSRGEPVPADVEVGEREYQRVKQQRRRSRGAA